MLMVGIRRNMILPDVAFGDRGTPASTEASVLVDSTAGIDAFFCMLQYI